MIIQITIGILALLLLLFIYIFLIRPIKKDKRKFYTDPDSFDPDRELWTIESAMNRMFSKQVGSERKMGYIST